MTDSAPDRRRVLVAAATTDEADSLRALLTVWGCDVRTTTDWAAAVETAQTFRPGLALLDLRLNGLNGSEVARRLRTLPGAGGVTLVALAAYDARADKDRPRADGFDHVLTLPVDPEDLRRIAAH